MNELRELYKKLDEIVDLVSIENDTENCMVDAYNDGVKSLAANIRYYINERLPKVMVGGGK